MNTFEGRTLSWSVCEGVIEVALHHPPANEIGSQTIEELETLVANLDKLEQACSAMIIHSTLDAGFSAGADLRELYRRTRDMNINQRVADVRTFLERIHAVLNRIDASPLTTLAACNGVTFGGGFELALTCDLIVADKLTRFCFPELRLGLIPGFGGIPRLKRDLGNGLVRDLLLTGRSINAQKAHNAGLVSQLAGEGQALHVARTTARQTTKFDPVTRAAAKKFIKPLPHVELTEEIHIFCELLARPAVDEGLRRFVESSAPYPYLP